MSQTVYTTFHSSEPGHHVPTVRGAEGVGQAGERSSSLVCERGVNVRPWCCIGWRLAALPSALLEMYNPKYDSGINYQIITDGKQVLGGGIPP